MVDMIKTRPETWWAYFSNYQDLSCGVIQSEMRNGIAGQAAEIQVVSHTRLLAVEQELERVRKNYADLLARQQQIMQANTLYHDAFEILTDGPDNSDEAMAADHIKQANKIRREVLGEDGSGRL